jgi:hypothetical protein
MKQYNAVSNTFADDTEAGGLLDALAWIEDNAEADAEYLVRVEKSELLPKIILAGKGVDVTIRLRGHGVERVLTFDSSTKDTALLWHPAYYSFSGGGNLSNIVRSGHKGFITIGAKFLTQPKDVQNFATNRVTLVLEEHITVSGVNAEVSSTVATSYTTLVKVHPYSRLVMRSGSKLADFISTYTATASLVVMLEQSSIYTQRKIGKFIMTGGTITNNTVNSTVGAVINLGTNENNANAEGITGLFQKNGGSVTGNNYDKLRWSHELYQDIEEQMYKP